MRRYFTALALGLAIAAATAIADDSRWIEVVGGSWKPDAAVLSEMESALKSAVPPAAADRGPMPQWDSYWFQYQGQSSPAGPRYVMVHALCRTFQNHPLSGAKWAYASDGGACYFSGKYESETKRLYDLLLNGPIRGL